MRTGEQPEDGPPPRREYDRRFMEQEYEEQRASNTNVYNAPQVTTEKVDVPPAKRVVEIEQFVEELTEKTTEIPHTQYIERLVEQPIPIPTKRNINVPKVDVLERIIQIPKHIQEEKIVELLETQVVEKIVEKPQYIIKEKIKEKPVVILQERIIPVPKRVVEEKIIEIPAEQYAQIVPQEHAEYVPDLYPDTGKATAGKRGTTDAFGNFVDGESEEESEVGALYKHIPKPVEIPITHYTPAPVERVIHRSVPIPVEIEVTQEFVCPRLEPVYKEVPVPIPVTRVIEEPVPVDAIYNKYILDAYLAAQEQKTYQPIPLCGKETLPGSYPTVDRLSPEEMESKGIGANVTTSALNRFQSRAMDIQRLGSRTDYEPSFMFRGRTIQKGEKT